MATSGSKVDLTTQEGRRRFVWLVCSLVLDSYETINQWDFYLFNEKFDGEPELRGKISTILFSAFYDNLDAKRRVLQEYREAASSQQLEKLQGVCDYADECFEMVTDILGSFSREEQIFLQEYRDICVHNWLHRRQQGRVWVKYVANAQLIREEISGEELLAIVRSFAEKGHHQEIEQIRRRLTPLLVPYWHKLVAFNQAAKNGLMADIYRETDKNPVCD